MLNIFIMIHWNDCHGNRWNSSPYDAMTCALLWGEQRIWVFCFSVGYSPKNHLESQRNETVLPGLDSPLSMLRDVGKGGLRNIEWPTWPHAFPPLWPTCIWGGQERHLELGNMYSKWGNPTQRCYFICWQWGDWFSARVKVQVLDTFKFFKVQVLDMFKMKLLNCSMYRGHLLWLHTEKFWKLTNHWVQMASNQQFLGNSNVRWLIFSQKYVNCPLSQPLCQRNGRWPM